MQRQNTNRKSESFKVGSVTDCKNRAYTLGKWWSLDQLWVSPGTLLCSLMAVGTKERLKRFVLHQGASGRRCPPSATVPHREDWKGFPGNFQSCLFSFSLPPLVPPDCPAADHLTADPPHQPVEPPNLTSKPTTAKNTVLASIDWHL